MKIILISLILCIALSSAIDLRGTDPSVAKNLSAQNQLVGWHPNELPDLGHYYSGSRLSVQDPGPTETYLVQFANNDTSIPESILNTTEVT